MEPSTIVSHFIWQAAAPQPGGRPGVDAATQPAWAVLGALRRTAQRAGVVPSVAMASAYATANASASNEAAAVRSAQSAHSAQAAADASDAAAKQAAASADKAAAQAQAEASTKTPQQELAELQLLYGQKLVSQSDYEAAKTKILKPGDAVRQPAYRQDEP